MSRHYKLRTKEQRLKDLSEQRIRLEASHEKRVSKIVRLREEEQALANAIAEKNKPVEAPPNG